MALSWQQYRTYQTYPSGKEAGRRYLTPPDNWPPIPDSVQVPVPVPFPPRPDQTRCCRIHVQLIDVCWFIGFSFPSLECGGNYVASAFRISHFAFCIRWCGQSSMGYGLCALWREPSRPKCPGPAWRCGLPKPLAKSGLAARGITACGHSPVLTQEYTMCS